MTDLFTEGMTEEQLAYQALFENQLKYTADMINRLREGHKHYTDDCGDYLSAALDLSAKMQDQRMEGIETFTAWMNEMKDDDDFWQDFASDGVSPQIYEWLGHPEG